MMDDAYGEYTRPNCSQCIHLPHCGSWAALTDAEDCPAFSVGLSPTAQVSLQNMYGLLEDVARD